MKKLAIILTLLLASQSFSQNKLTLEDCLKIALLNNKDLQISKENLSISKENKTIARAGFIPEFGLSHTSSKTKTGDATFKDRVQIPTSTGIVSKDTTITQEGGTNLNHSLGLQLSKTFSLATFKNYEQSKISLNHSKNELESLISQVVESVTQKYLDLLQAKELEKVAEENLKLSEEQLARAENLYKIGTQTKASFLQSKVSLGTDKINLINQQQNVRLAEANLSVVIGKSPFERLEISEDFTKTLPIFNLNQVFEEAKNSNFDLKVKDLEIKQSETQEKIAKSGYLPNFTGSLSYRRSNSDFGEVYSNLGENWSFSGSATVSINLFDGFEREANVQKAKLEKIIAQRNYEKEVQNLGLQIRQSYENLQTSIEVIKINQEKIVSAEEDLKLAKERYTIGSGTQLEYRDTQVALIRAKTDLVVAEFDAQKQVAKIKQLTGKE
ncbi:TolC family protein [bacterium]|nr:TolC family protein [bacterium]